MSSFLLLLATFKSVFVNNNWVKISDLRNIAIKIGLTPAEFRVLLALVILFVAGVTIKYFVQADEKVEIYYYTKQDSLFIYRGINSDSVVSYAKLLEKKVDSKQELLDFSGNKFIEKPILASSGIDINTADLQTLVLLPGIGEKTAAKIINYRKINGRFNKLTDLLRVKGIGQKKLNKIKSFIFIE